jgi:hypothetical protein
MMEKKWLAGFIKVNSLAKDCYMLLNIAHIRLIEPELPSEGEVTYPAIIYTSDRGNLQVKETFAELQDMLVLGGCSV